MALKTPIMYNNKCPKTIKDSYFMLFNYRDYMPLYAQTIYTYKINEDIIKKAMHFYSDEDYDEYDSGLISSFFTEGHNQFHYFNPFPFSWGHVNPVEYTQTDVSLITNYGQRKLLKSMFDDLIGWDATEGEFQYVRDCIIQNIINSINQHYYKWKNLYKSCVLEFNPLWNVDGNEETTRTLEQGGTIQNQKRGNDLVAHDESNQYKKTGTVTDKKTGTETNLKSGTESTDVTNETVEENSGTDTETLSKTTTESSTWYDTEKSTKVNGLKVTSSSKNDSLTTHNVTDKLTHDVTDLTTNNTTDTDTKDIDITTTYNNNDTMTRELLDTERIMLKRQGNIGVTTTTKLLTEFREYVNLNLGKVIAHDIANDISEGVY